VAQQLVAALKSEQERASLVAALKPAIEGRAVNGQRRIFEEKPKTFLAAGSVSSIANGSGALPTIGLLGHGLSVTK
jgi:hypothetical protein